VRRPSRSSPVRLHFRRAYVLITAFLMVVLALQPVEAAVAPGASATPTWAPVFQGQAGQYWGYLENQATSLIADHGLSRDTSEQYARSLIRSYVFGSLVNLITEPLSELTPDDVNALDYLDYVVHQERDWTAINAYTKYENYASQQGCGSLNTNTYTATGGATCVFNEMFGKTPDAAAFTSAGFAETFRAFDDPTISSVFLDTTNSLSWWPTLKAVTGESATDVTLEQDLKDVLEDQVSEAAREALGEVGSALVEVAADGAADPAGVVLAAAAVAVVLAYGIWNAVDAGGTAHLLQSKSLNAVSDLKLSTPLATIQGMDPATVRQDLAKLASSGNGAAGETELMYLVLSQSVQAGQDMPAGTTISTHVLTSGGSWSSPQFPCSFPGNSDCYGYAFSSDSDYVAARYPSSSVPAHGPGDPDFLISHQGSQAPATLSTTMQPANSFLVPWVASGCEGHATVYDLASARHVVNLDVNQDLSTDGCHELALYDGGEGYSSYIANNMFVTQYADSANPAGIGSSWLNSPGVRYVDWDGNWWEAWYNPKNNTFVHVKIASPVTGTLTPGTALSLYGYSPCVEDPSLPSIGFSSLLQIQQGNCLFATPERSPYDIENLGAGHALLVDGGVRVVGRVDWCHNVAAFFGLGTQHCSPGNSQPSGYPRGLQTQAVFLQPGVSTDWQAFTAWGIVATFLGLPGTWSWGPSDSHVMNLVNANTCAGRSNCTGSSDLSNCYGPVNDPSEMWSYDCFVSPTIDYQATTPTGTQNWSATLRPAASSLPPKRSLPPVRHQAIQERAWPLSPSQLAHPSSRARGLAT
jgi:hypothetical protein